MLYTPITYRGYNYDLNTGLYYLQSRYYNPTYGRFLNADTTEILEKTKGTVLGANLFAYCNNNPVMNVDYTGELHYMSIVVIVIFFVLLFSLIGNTGKDNIESSENEWRDKVNDALEEMGLPSLYP